VTRTRWSDADRETLTQPCPHCRAGPWSWCTTVWSRRPGKPATQLHTERRHAARYADGRLFDTAQKGA
jgi:hypothetical protein